MEAALMAPPTRKGPTWRKHVPCPLCVNSTSALLSRNAAAPRAAALGLPARLRASAQPPLPGCAERPFELPRQLH
eukprot:2576618-Alexandrium_andersonii.AAC.1